MEKQSCDVLIDGRRNPTHLVVIEPIMKYVDWIIVISNEMELQIGKTSSNQFYIIAFDVIDDHSTIVCDGIAI